MPPCTNCPPTTGSPIPNPYTTNCGCTDECGIDFDKLVYTGANLPCSGIENGDSGDTILSKLDQAVCTVTGNYSTYNTACLSGITTPQTFVETISSFVCTLRSDFDTFTGTTFLNYQTSINTRITNLEAPGITCVSAGILATDNISSIYAKYCDKFSQIDASIGLAGVNWNQCFTISTPPTTIAGAFNLVFQQICQLNSVSTGGALPTFNNVGSCLASPGAADSLVDTVNKLKTRVCQSPTFDINALTWNCVAKPSNVTSNLQAAFQSLLTKLDSLSQAIPTFGSGFNVANVDNSNPCLGKAITLSAGTSTDKFVAVNGSDSTPGYLAAKLVAGTNISLDAITSPGTLIINSSGGGTDEKVKAFAGDLLPGYLDNKITSGPASNGISLVFSNDVPAGQVKISPSVNLASLVTAILEEVANNDALKTMWCNLNTSCPSPCSAPSNISVTYSGIGTTTTTTTTT